MIDLERVEKLSPKDGDVFCLPADTSEEDAKAFADALWTALPGIKCSVILGNIVHLITSDMNAAGWVRK